MCTQCTFMMVVHNIEDKILPKPATLTFHFFTKMVHVHVKLTVQYPLHDHKHKGKILVDKIFIWWQKFSLYKNFYVCIVLPPQELTLNIFLTTFFETPTLSVLIICSTSLRSRVPSPFLSAESNRSFSQRSRILVLNLSSAKKTYSHISFIDSYKLYVCISANDNDNNNRTDYFTPCTCAWGN